MRPARRHRPVRPLGSGLGAGPDLPQPRFERGRPGQGRFPDQLRGRIGRLRRLGARAFPDARIDRKRRRQGIEPVRQHHLQPVAIGRFRPVRHQGRHVPRRREPGRLAHRKRSPVFLRLARRHPDRIHRSEPGQRPRLLRRSPDRLHPASDHDHLARPQGGDDQLRILRAVPVAGRAGFHRLPERPPDRVGGQQLRLRDPLRLRRGHGRNRPRLPGLPPAHRRELLQQCDGKRASGQRQLFLSLERGHRHHRPGRPGVAGDQRLDQLRRPASRRPFEHAQRLAQRRRGLVPSSTRASPPITREASREAPRR